MLLHTTVPLLMSTVIVKISWLRFTKFAALLLGAVNRFGLIKQGDRKAVLSSGGHRMNSCWHECDCLVFWYFNLSTLLKQWAFTRLKSGGRDFERRWLDDTWWDLDWCFGDLMIKIIICLDLSLLLPFRQVLRSLAHVKLKNGVTLSSSHASNYFWSCRFYPE